MYPSVIAEELQVDWVRRYRANPARTNQSLKLLKAPDGIVVGGTSVNPAGNSDYVLLKYSMNGDEMWTRRYDSSGGSEDVARDIASDSSGNVFVTGTTHTVKYDKQGTLIWTNTLGGRAITASTNFVYLTGFSEVDFATSQIKNDLTGAQTWVRTYDGRDRGVDISTAIALGVNGGIFVAGRETAASDRSGYYCTYTLLKYSAAGDQVNFEPLRGVFPTGLIPRGVVRSLLVDGPGFVYLYGDTGVLDKDFVCWGPDTSLNGGNFAGYDSVGEMVLVSDGLAAIARDDARFPGGPWDASVVTYRTNGVTVWTNTFTSGFAGDSSALGVTAISNNIYATGYTPSAAGDLDLFVIGYTVDGTRLQKAIYDSGSGKSDIGKSIVSDDAGNLYVTGYSTTPEGGSEFLTIKFSQRPKIEAKPNGIMHIEFHTIPGQEYAIEGTSDFFNWQSLITNTADVNGLIQFDDTNAPNIPYRFYRGKQP